MALEDKDILQVDATIITGILILLSLSNIVGGAASAQKLAASIAGILIPMFSVSAILILLSRRRAGRRKDEKPDKMLSISIGLTIVGFILLVLIILFFFYVLYLNPGLLERVLPSHIFSQNVTHPAKLAK